MDNAHLSRTVKQASQFTYFTYSNGKAHVCVIKAIIGVSRGMAPVMLNFDTGWRQVVIFMP